MNLFKKIAAFALCGLSVLGFVGCSSPDDIEPGDDLFTKPVNNTFNYCPSILQTDENTRYIFYCTNVRSGVVQDHVGARKGTRVKGRWTWSEQTIALAPTEGKYDGLHVCDPSVIQGQFAYDGTEYKYLMTYTGNTSHINNKVGLAVSNELLSGWVKVENPFVVYSGDPERWGVGRSTLVSVDKAGVVLLFYSASDSDTGTEVERWNLRDLNNPVREYSVPLTNRGLTDLNGQSPDRIYNVDAAYDPVRKRFYAVSECQPNPQDEPNIMGSHVRVTYIGEPGAAPGDLFADAEGAAAQSWSTQGLIGPNETGFPRNHNGGLVTDPYGWMLPGDTLSLYYSMSLTGKKYEWTYCIYNYELTLDK
ncbi:hypothetical protein FACS1894211_13900 [Clostridia bacterium]|nr:hypothetical protein FACS1894211_13900 [Clostridia bacterium]